MKISELAGDEDSGPTCRTYVFQDESHTLGNALKCIISRYEDVQFCGYTVPHPAEAKMHFRIQTQETPALEILKRGLKDLEKVCNHTIDLFESKVKDFTKTYIMLFHSVIESAACIHLHNGLFKRLSAETDQSNYLTPAASSYTIHDKDRSWKSTANFSAFCSFGEKYSAG